MRVKVYAGYGGHERCYWLIEFNARGQRVKERVMGFDWNRSAARDALDLLQYGYGLSRRNVRFEVV